LAISAGVWPSALRGRIGIPADLLFAELTSAVIFHPGLAAMAFKAVGLAILLAAMGIGIGTAARLACTVVPGLSFRRSIVGHASRSFAGTNRRRRRAVPSTARHAHPPIPEPSIF
jgi:hypothetical protein